VTEESSELSALLERYPPQVRELARAARRLVRAAGPALREEVDAAAGVVGYGREAGYAGLVCTLILSQRGVKLGLVGSAGWPDPDGLLAGTGKRHRYVAVDSLADLESPGVRRLLDYAVARTG